MTSEGEAYLDVGGNLGKVLEIVQDNLLPNGHAESDFKCVGVDANSLPVLLRSCMRFNIRVASNTFNPWEAAGFLGGQDPRGLEWSLDCGEVALFPSKWAEDSDEKDCGLSQWELEALIKKASAKPAVVEFSDSDDSDTKHVEKRRRITVD